jgi:hypothetical protein
MYARLTADLLSIETLNALTDEQYATLLAANNPKTLRHRIQVIAPVPALTATQKAVALPWAVEAERVFQGWQVVEKNADELEAEAVAAAKDGYQAHIDALNLQLDITNAMRGAMSTNQRLNTLEADTRATMRAVKDLLRQAKRSF